MLNNIEQLKIRIIYTLVAVARETNQWVSGNFKILDPKVKFFINFSRRFHSRAPVEAGASSVVPCETRKGEGLIRRAFPLIWASALAIRL